jgi:predicted DNA-binding ribbon-helix-helix protein
MRGKSRLVSRNIFVGGARTSTRQTPDVWKDLEAICHLEDIHLGQLMDRIKGAYSEGNFSAAISAYVYNYWQEALAREVARVS